MEEPSTGTPRSDEAHQLRLIEFFIALTSGVLIWLWFVLTAFALVRFDFVFGTSAFAETSNSVLAITCAFACRLTELAAAPTLEAGTTPPTELAKEPSKVTFAIKLNTVILRCRLCAGTEGTSSRFDAHVPRVRGGPRLREMGTIRAQLALPSVPNDA